MLAGLLSNDGLLTNLVFQTIGVPIILTLLGGLFGALAGKDEKAKLEHWVLGADLCFEGWAINIALAINEANDPTNSNLQQTTSTLLAVTLQQLVLLAVVLYIQRFLHEYAFTRVILSIFLGTIAVVSAFYNWR
jgi:hypothetical protein